MDNLKPIVGNFYCTRHHGQQMPIKIPMLVDGVIKAPDLVQDIMDAEKTCPYCKVKNEINQNIIQAKIGEINESTTIYNNRSC